MLWVVDGFQPVSENVDSDSVLPDRLQQMARSAVKDSEFDLMTLIAHQRQHVAYQLFGPAGAHGGYYV
ncbi:hypothetical protein EEL40_10730 [Muribaculaceae bacterium Isolate-083 (Janvier)]|uniref:hypothetical protein n=1 Tax=Duncaniella muris TaxID=2094150 RepID=UPI000F46ADDE|nr:hypothetical protein [Duncaniella muris]ROS95657.1 hypothetical protein EEL40_10730 [Muribaculaceae bacterium Isolate-083 (Janvier)]